MKRIPRTRLFAGGAGAVVCVALATWYLIGPLRPKGAGANGVAADPDFYDYMVRAPSIDPNVARVVGWGAAGVVVASGVGFVRRLRMGLDRRWIGPVLLLALAGSVIGAGSRIVTAPVIGANIGGGIAILLGVPFVLLLGVGAALLSWSIRRSKPSSGDSHPKLGGRRDRGG